MINLQIEDQLCSTLDTSLISKNWCDSAIKEILENLTEAKKNQLRLLSTHV